MMPYKANEVIAIGSMEWCDQVEADSPEGTVVIRTLSGVAARQFKAHQLRIDPNVADCADFDKIQKWASQVICVRFSPTDYGTGRAILDSHNLLVPWVDG
jgi:hypothetical protein